MEITKKLIEASLRVREQYYAIIALEHKRKRGILYPGEYEAAIEKLKDLILNEDIENERFKEALANLSEEEVINMIVSEETDSSRNVLLSKLSAEKRLSAKAKKDQFGKERTIMNIEEAVENASQIDGSSTQLKSILAKIKNDAQKYVEFLSLIAEKTEVDFKKCLYFFIMKQLENEEDISTFFKVMTSLFIEIYEDPTIEKSLIDHGFHPDKSWIAVDDIPEMSETETSELLKKREHFCSQIVASELGDLSERTFDNSLDSKTAIMFIRTKVRAAVYLLDGASFEHLKNCLIELKDNYRFKDNQPARSILQEIIDEISEDRKLYPKIERQSLKMNGEVLVNISSAICGYYDRLAELEIRRLNGEDTDFEYQRIIEAIKMATVEENRIYGETIPKYIEADLFQGVSIAIGYASADKVVTKRVEEKIEEMLKSGKVKKAIIQKLGLPAKSKIESKPDDSFDLSQLALRNTLFFINDSIKKVDKRVRDFLVKYKYQHICKTVFLEQTLLDSHFEISEGWITLPDNIGVSSEENSTIAMERGSLVVLQNLVENTLYFDARDEELDGKICIQIAQIRGLLYSLNNEVYENTMKVLTDMLKEPFVLENPIVYTVINGGINEAKQDRVKYPKLTFKAD